MPVKDPINPINMNGQSRIYQLTPELANQIAAGEVVERPASILKELLENSLDAGSSQIDVSIERGGLGLIKVQDNGHGICKEDLELALSQHATSKILSFADLEGVASFGFRGEALASISAVSRLSLSSCVLGQTSGFSIQKEGRHGNVRLSVSPPVLGTSVEARDIFYNTPARRKFLRSEKTESLYIEECFKRIALSQPRVSFTLKIDAKPLKRWVACKTLEAESRRVAELCSLNFMKTAHYIEMENNGLKIKGWLGSAEQWRTQADLQYFYVNGRSVRDKVVSYALRQAYQEYQVPGRYPAYVLFFELDPEAVDVNVHPTKHEVRFREVRAITAFLIYSVRQALTQSMTIAMPMSMQMPRQIPRQIQMPMPIQMTNNNDAAIQPIQSIVEQRLTQTLGSTSLGLGPSPLLTERTESTELTELTKLTKLRELRELRELEELTGRTELSELVDTEFLDRNGNVEPGLALLALPGSMQMLEQKPPRQTPPRSDKLIHKILSILGNELLLAENPSGLVLVDISAVIKARTRKILTEFLEDPQDIPVQSRPLLMPLRLELKNLEKNHYLENHKINFAQLGFSWSQIGPTSILIRQVPCVIKTMGDDFEILFEKLLSASQMEQALELICEYVAQQERLDLSLEKAESLIKDLEIVLADTTANGKTEKRNIVSSVLPYRQIKIEDLRWNK